MTRPTQRRREFCLFVDAAVFAGGCALAGPGGTVRVVGAQPVLDHVQIAAPPGCEAQARRFYGTVIGLPELEKPQPLRARGGVWFGLGDAQLHIGIQEPFAPARKAHPAMRFSNDELDAVAQRLTDVGAPVRWDEELPNVPRFFTDDPWGNRLELLARRD